MTPISPPKWSHFHTPKNDRTPISPPKKIAPPKPSFSKKDRPSHPQQAIAPPKPSFSKNDRIPTPQKRAPSHIPLKNDRTSKTIILKKWSHSHTPKSDRTPSHSQNSDRHLTYPKKRSLLQNPHHQNDRTSHIPKSDRTSKILIIKKRSHLQNPHYQSDRTSTSPKMIAHSLSFLKPTFRTWKKNKENKKSPYDKR